MAIQPIDLQVLFSRLDQVGKEQSAVKDVHAQQQVQQAGDLVKKTDLLDHSVNQSQQVDHNSVEKLKQEGRRQRERRNKEKHAAPVTNEAPLEVLQDPALGKKIDITG
jgi:hypothetical protein